MICRVFSRGGLIAQQDIPVTEDTQHGPFWPQLVFDALEQRPSLTKNNRADDDAVFVDQLQLCQLRNLATRTAAYPSLALSQFSSASDAHKLRNLFDFRKLDRYFTAIADRNLRSEQYLGEL